MVNEDQGDDNDNFLEVRSGVCFIPGDPEGTPRGFTLFITKLLSDLYSFLELSL